MSVTKVTNYGLAKIYLWFYQEMKSKLVKFLFVCALCFGFAYLLVWIFN